MLNLLSIKKSYENKRVEITNRIQEFEAIGSHSDNKQLFEEMAYCIFTAGASAKMGINAVNATRQIIHCASATELSAKLHGVYRFPNIRSKYIVHTRDYLSKEFNMDIRKMLKSLNGNPEKRKFLATNKNVKGLGFKEASHYLRNIGFRGYGILDKHIVNCMYELGITDSNKPPSTEKKYLELEARLKRFSELNNIDFDHLDLLLWSEKTGSILK